MRDTRPLVILTTLAVYVGVASAHNFTITQAKVVLSADGQYRIDLRVDVDALALGVSTTVDSFEVARALRAMSPTEFDAAVQHARHTLLRRTRVRFDGVKQQPTVTFPEHTTSAARDSATPTVLGTVARLEGLAPRRATVFRFGVSRAFQVLHLTIHDESTGGTVTHVLEAGADSPPFRLGQAVAGVGVWSVVRQYTCLGFAHILPKGLDHLLFLLGLFLLSPRARPLMWQVSAFTIAHSVTLALAMAGVFSLPANIVEPLIALSIAYVAVENMCTTELKPWRPAVVFAFGLLHGLGFAGALRELGLPAGQFAVGLVAFNIGVELGQIAVVLLAFLTIGLFRHKEWYRRRVILPASLVIALIGMYWVVVRIV